MPNWGHRLEPDEVDDVVVVRDFYFPGVNVDDELLHGPRPNPKLAPRVDPDLGAVAFVEMTSAKLKNKPTLSGFAK